MANIQELYSEDIAATLSELNAAKLRHDEAIKKQLLFGLSEEKVVEFIGNNLLFCLVMIIANKHKGLIIGSNGYNSYELNVEADDIGNFLITEIPDDIYESIKYIDIFINFIESFFKSNDFFNITQLEQNFRATPNYIISLTDYENDYLEEFTYREDYLLLEKYIYFYNRIEEVFKKNIKIILEKNMTGEFVSIMETLKENYPFQNMLQEAKFPEDKMHYGYKPTKDDLKEMLKICFNYEHIVKEDK